jgi:hypothetical protein
MTSCYPSKNSALDMALCYAGSKQKHQDLTVKEVRVINQFGNLIDVEIYEIDGVNGKAEVGIENFRDGFALWLINPNGMAVRT